MRITSLAATPAALFLPSRSTHVTAGKLALIGMLFTTFFLFTAGYHFPGGATHYPNWAESIVHGKTLPPDVAQREVGLPLLYILSGFTITHSFIGITLIYGLFAVLTAVLVYWSLVRASPTIAFFMGMVCILSLAPFTYLKFFYPDQLYMFVNLLAIALLIEFFWTGQFRMLYFFTLAAVLASFTRTAGNLMYPVLMSIAYVTVRGRLRHYVGCALIFVLAAGAYQWHRYEIFDTRNQPSIPSGKGMQVLYSTYLYLGDFGYRLSPDVGPNTKRLFDRMREELQPNVRDSALIKKGLGDSPPEFMEKYFYALTPEQLIEKIATEPNEEYYWNVVNAVDTNDQFFLDVAKEIARAYPWYVVRYSMRNLWHALFDPGYATTRYNTLGFIKTGGEFPPGTQGWGVRSEDPVTQYGSRAAREMQYFALQDQPPAIQKIFSKVQILYLEKFHTYVWITSVALVIAWIGASLGLLCWAFPRLGICRAVTTAGIDKLTAPVIAASALLLYEDLATSMFSQPVYRYFHMTEPWRLVIAGFGLVYVMRLLAPIWRKKIAVVEATASRSSRQSMLSAIQKYDLFERYFGGRPGQWICLLIAVNAGLFAWWASSTIARTWNAPPIEIVSATYGQSCQGFGPNASVENLVRDGNVTSFVKKACEAEGNRWCNILVDDTAWGDPAAGCEKDFSVDWRCRPHESPRSISVAAPAGGKSVAIDCNGRPPEPGLRIRSATYGSNCGAAHGNATRSLASSCNDTWDCAYKVDVNTLGDPAPKCGKDFIVSYSCAPDTTILRENLPAEAGLGSILTLSCPLPEATSGLNIRSATYGGNCGAAQGNTTRKLVSSCNGKRDCSYKVDVQTLGDPAPKCGKDFVVSYSCAPDRTILRKELPAEAGFGSILSLSCTAAASKSAKP